MFQVEKFHILSQIFISLIGGILLLAIWYNIQQRFSKILKEVGQKRLDKGLLYLSLAVFVWAISGTWTYMVEFYDFSSEVVEQLVRSLFSTLNNLLFLLALFHFYHAPAFLYKNEKNAQRIIIAIIGISALSFFLFQSLGESANASGIRFAFVPDLLLSGFLSSLLIISFYKTFAHRGLKLIGVISVVLISLMFLSQLPEVFGGLYDDFDKNLIQIVAKTSLISIFLVLATTWVIELASTPVASEMGIKFMDWSVLKITIPSKGIIDQTVDFGSKTTQYRNLLKFATRRKSSEGNAQYIEVHAGGEIKSQTYLTRIIDNINQILKLEGEQKLERKDLFTFIGNGKYRLRILPENILIDKVLEEEFVGNEGIDLRT